MKAKTISGNNTKELQAALQESFADGFKPALAIVFISIKQDREAIVKILNEYQIDILGATSAGEFVDGNQSQGATAMLLIEMNPAYYSMIYEDIGDRTIQEVASSMAKKACQKFSKPAFIICSTGVSAKGNLFDGEALVGSLADEFGPNTNMYGGMAGDDITFSGSYVFSNHEETDYGIVTLVLDEEKINLTGMAISGWKPLGISRKITKCQDDWIQTIDDKPALEMYLRYLGMEVKPGDDKYKMFEDVGVHFPFQVEGVGNPLMRTPFLADNESNAIKLDFPVPEGTAFKFSVPPDFEIVENVLEKAQALKEGSQVQADALLIFSCAGRFSALGPMTKMENEGLYKIWNAPMAGFFTYGEFGMGHNGKQEFFSTTCCWVALKEK